MANKITVRVKECGHLIGYTKASEQYLERISTANDIIRNKSYYKILQDEVLYAKANQLDNKDYRGGHN